MSIFKRAADAAKSNIDALRDKVAGRELADYSDEELHAELERRKMERASGPQRPGTTSADPAAAASPAQKEPADEMTRAYASLELRPGADLETVKAQYRKLIRHYHPDRHAGDPEKHKVAVDLAQKLTKAYMRIREQLEKT